MNNSQIDIFEKIAHEFIGIQNHVEYLFGLFLDDQGKREKNVLYAAAPMFFKLTFELFYNHILLSLSKLNDPAKQGNFENLSIKNLISKLEPLPPSISSVVNAKMNQIDQALSNAILSHRNKRMAHNDLSSKLIPGQLPRVTEKDLYSALEGFKELLNIISKHYLEFERDYDSTLTPNDMPSALIEMIKRGLEKA